MALHVSSSYFFLCLTLSWSLSLASFEINYTLLVWIILPLFCVAYLITGVRFDVNLVASSFLTFNNNISFTSRIFFRFFPLLFNRNHLYVYTLHTTSHYTQHNGDNGATEYPTLTEDQLIQCICLQDTIWCTRTHTYASARERLYTTMQARRYYFRHYRWWALWVAVRGVCISE